MSVDRDRSSGSAASSVRPTRDRILFWNNSFSTGIHRQGELLRHDLSSVPVGRFVSPITGLVEKTDRDRLAGKTAQVDRDILPLDTLAVPTDDRLMPHLAIDFDGQLPVSFFVSRNAQPERNLFGGWQCG